MCCHVRMHRMLLAVGDRLNAARRNRSGLALPGVLVTLMVGGLMIAPTLGFMGTGVRAGKLMQDHVSALYAADAGVEHGLWKLQNAPPTEYPHTYQLTGVNGMPVDVTLSVSNVLWGFTIGESGIHSSTLLLHASMVWDQGQSNYLYTISLTNTNNSNVHLDSIMVTPPTGYAYVDGSSSGITEDPPEVAGDPNGNTGLIWDFGTPRPNIPAAPNPEGGVYSTVYQYMRLSGDPGYNGAAGYIWVSAEREDIGTVSTAVAMKVTARALQGGVPKVTASALVLRDNATGSTLVGSWQLD